MRWGTWVLEGDTASPLTAAKSQACLQGVLQPWTGWEGLVSRAKTGSSERGGSLQHVWMLIRRMTRYLSQCLPLWSALSLNPVSLSNRHHSPCLPLCLLKTRPCCRPRVHFLPEESTPHPPSWPRMKCQASSTATSRSGLLVHSPSLLLLPGLPR